MANKFARATAEEVKRDFPIGSYICIDDEYIGMCHRTSIDVYVYDGDMFYPAHDYSNDGIVEFDGDDFEYWLPNID